MTHLEEQASKAFKNFNDSQKDFSSAVQDMKNPSDVEVPLALQGIMRDRQLSFLNFASWVRHSDTSNFGNIELDQ